MKVWLSNWSSHRTPGQHGPGRRLCAMAAPRHWELGDGTVPLVHPLLDDLEDLRRERISMREYLIRYHTQLVHAGRGGGLAPGELRVAHSGAWHHQLEYAPPDGSQLVEDGDTLCCACPRRGSDAWERPCHLEVLARHLARAGWEVSLYGRDLVHLAGHGITWVDTGAAVLAVP